MKCLKIMFVVAILMVLAISLGETLAEQELTHHVDKDGTNETSDTSSTGSQNLASLRGTTRFLAEESLRGVMKCNKYPRVCWLKDSPGTDCCKKKCVNVTVDSHNCGMCGKKCKYSEICCEGECVNPSYNKKHCGSCNNKCEKGNSCVFGICSYA